MQSNYENLVPYIHHTKWRANNLKIEELVVPFIPVLIFSAYLATCTCIKGSLKKTRVGRGLVHRLVRRLGSRPPEPEVPLSSLTEEHVPAPKTLWPGSESSCPWLSLGRMRFSGRHRWRDAPFTKSIPSLEPFNVRPSLYARNGPYDT